MFDKFLAIDDVDTFRQFVDISCLHLLTKQIVDNAISLLSNGVLYGAGHVRILNSQCNSWVYAIVEGIGDGSNAICCRIEVSDKAFSLFGDV